MYKLLLAFSALSALVVAQDLDAIVLDIHGDIYGPTEPEYEVNTETTESTDNVAVNDTNNERQRRQVPLEDGIACVVQAKSGPVSGRCVLFDICFRKRYDNAYSFLDLQKALRICEATGEVCCPV